jgi:hypothetical protein
MFLCLLKRCIEVTLAFVNEGGAFRYSLRYPGIVTCVAKELLARGDNMEHDWVVYTSVWCFALDNFLYSKDTQICH